MVAYRRADEPSRVDIAFFAIIKRFSADKIREGHVFFLFLDVFFFSLGLLAFRFWVLDFDFWSVLFLDYGLDSFAFWLLTFIFFRLLALWLSKMFELFFTWFVCGFH